MPDTFQIEHVWDIDAYATIVIMMPEAHIL